ncbi:LamG domain-containing protein, partial [Candidatus Poribacteria bacterium]|nr:LamG domain-containing protein [Candidatus Poribacteria bacterium]
MLKPLSFTFILLVTLNLSIPALAAINTKDILGIWTMDEGSGKEVKDLSGNGHDGELVGNAKWVDGKSGKALEFSGGNVRVPHKEDMNLETFSMMAWLNVPKVVAPYQMVMGKEAWPNRNYSMWLLPEKVNVGITEPADKQTQSAAVVVDGKWHHVAATYDKKFLKIYVDGEVSNQIALTSKPLTCDAPFMIGAQPPGGGGPVQGIMDEVSVFKVGLADEDIKKIMNEGLKKLVTSVDSSKKLVETWGNIKR